MSDDNETQLGVDVAEGGDQTVVAVRRGKRIEPLFAWVEPNLMKSVEKVQEIAERYRVTPRVPDDWWFKYRTPPQEPRGRIVVDAIGVGSGVASRLHELGYTVEPFRGNAAAPPPRNKYAMLYANRRAASYFQFREWIRDGGQLPPDRLLDEEVLASTYGFQAGRTMITDKKELRTHLGRSPDRLDSCVLSVWRDPQRISHLCAHGQW